MSKASKTTLTPELIAPVLSKDFYQFVVHFWSTVSNDRFQDGEHIKALCLHLQALAEGRIRRLVCLVAVRHSKSLLTSVFFPAFLWARKPEERIISATYNKDLTTRDAQRTRQLIQSPAYQECFGHVFKLSEEEARKDFYSNDAKGHRLSVSIGSSTSGKDADVLIVDDLHDFATRKSQAEREAAMDYFLKTLTGRLVLGNDRVVIAGHRVHEDDVYAKLLKEFGDTYTWCVLPSEANPELSNGYPNALGCTDQRKPGELLWPVKYDEGMLKQERLKYRHEYSAVFLQVPTPQEGNLFKPEWFQYYDSVPSDAWNFSTTDLAIGTKTSNDWTVIANWSVSKGRLYLVDLVRRRVDGSQLIQTITTAVRGHKSDFVVVEDVAFQRMVIDQLRNEELPVKRYKPDSDKEARSITAQVLAESGRVFLPNGKPFVADFLSEVCAFPFSRFDDQQDVFSLAAIMMSKYGRHVEPVELTPQQKKEAAKKEADERFKRILWDGLPVF